MDDLVYDPGHATGIVVQLPRGCEWDMVEDLDLFQELEIALALAFEEINCGAVLEGSAGLETADIYASVEPDRWDAALATVIEELRRRELMTHAVIAKARRLEAGAGWEYTVVWPTHYPGPFRPTP